MNDLPYIFYKPSLMYLDTIGMSRDCKVAHRQLADYVWINDGPPANENEILREITSCAERDWARVKRELIGKGWVETPKFFLHKGIINALNLSKKKAVESYNKTAAANGLSKRELLGPDPETGVSLVRSLDVTQDVTPTDRDRDRDREEVGERARGGCGEIPEFEEAFAQTTNAAIPKDFCQFVFDDWSSRSGRDGGGNLVSWLPYVTKRWAREGTEWRAGTHKGKRSASAAKPSAGPTLAEVRELVREKFGDDPKSATWAASFFSHWNDAKRRWLRDGRAIDWRVELSAQCAKWRRES